VVFLVARRNLQELFVDIDDALADQSLEIGAEEAGRKVVKHIHEIFQPLAQLRLGANALSAVALDRLHHNGNADQRGHADNQ